MLNNESLDKFQVNLKYKKIGQLSHGMAIIVRVGMCHYGIRNTTYYYHQLIFQ